MPMRYPKDFRRAVCARLVAGERVQLALSRGRGVGGTLYLWKRKVELAGRSDRSGLGQKPDQQSDRQPRNNDDQQPRNDDQSEPQRVMSEGECDDAGACSVSGNRAS